MVLPRPLCTLVADDSGCRFYDWPRKPRRAEVDPLLPLASGGYRVGRFVLIRASRALVERAGLRVNFQRVDDRYMLPVDDMGECRYRMIVAPSWQPAVARAGRITVETVLRARASVTRRALSSSASGR